MQASDALPHGFNDSFVCCCLKKLPRLHPELGAYYFPKKTHRPFLLVNTDNRMLASSYRKIFEFIANDFVSGAQKDFLRKRSVLEKVVSVDYESMQISLKPDRRAIVLFDFEAACSSHSSLSHVFFGRSYFIHFCVPANVLNAFKMFYSDSATNIRIKVLVVDGLVCSSGIRYGCPSPPLFFVVVVD